MNGQLQEITLDDILSWNPCWDHKDISKVYKQTGLKSALPTVWAKRLKKKLKLSEFLWLFLREEFLTENEMRKIAVDAASKACYSLAVKNERVLKAIEVATKYVQGKAVEEELESAFNGSFNPIIASASKDHAAAFRAANRAAQGPYNGTIRHSMRHSLLWAAKSGVMPQEQVIGLVIGALKENEK